MSRCRGSILFDNKQIDPLRRPIHRRIDIEVHDQPLLNNLGGRDTIDERGVGIGGLGWSWTGAGSSWVGARHEPYRYHRNAGPGSCRDRCRLPPAGSGAGPARDRLHVQRFGNGITPSDCRMALPRCPARSRLPYPLRPLRESLGDETHLHRFLQAYAVEKATIEARRQGYSVSEAMLADGSVRLTVQAGGSR